MDTQGADLMINKSTPSILHGLTNGTDIERRPEADDLGVDVSLSFRLVIDSR